jgi:hypothetical protein
MLSKILIQQIPVATRSCGCSLYGTRGSNPAGSTDICLLSLLCGNSLCVGLIFVQRSSAGCGVSECDRGEEVLDQ